MQDPPETIVIIDNPEGTQTVGESVFGITTSPAVLYTKFRSIFRGRPTEVCVEMTGKVIVGFTLAAAISTLRFILVSR